MRTSERFLIYGALSLLVVVNLSSLLGDRRAEADPVVDTALGPADRLTLLGETPDGELVLRNRGGRVAWSDEAWSRALSIGFVHVGRALAPLLDSEVFKEEYAQLEAEVLERAREIEEGIGAFMQEHQDVDPEGPDAPRIREQYEEMLRLRETWRNEGRAQLGQLAARQIETAYREFLAAVDVVADRRGVDLVLRFIPVDMAFDAVNPPQAYTTIQGRVALKYPDGLDLTDQVLEELGVR